MFAQPKQCLNPTSVSITEVPDAPKQPLVKEVYQDSALISWEPPADGGKPITGYIVERKETKANRCTIITSYMTQTHRNQLL